MSPSERPPSPYPGLRAFRPEETGIFCGRIAHRAELLRLLQAQTDPEPLPADPSGLEGRPEAKNLVGIYGAVTGESVEQVLGRFAGQGFGVFKPALAEVLITLIEPLRTRLDQFRADPAELDRLLAEGSARAAELGAPTLAAAYKAVGLAQ